MRRAKRNMTNPYKELVAEQLRLLNAGRTYPLGGFPPAPRPVLPASAPRVLIFSPHPDDECVTGALALRLLREAHRRVVNVAVTQGSKKERQAERWRELQAACQFLGFELVATGPHGLEKINPQTRAQSPTHWTAAVRVIADILAQHQPQAILFPHELDWNSTHIGTHYLVRDALETLPASFETFTLETQFWGQMADPNLLVEVSADDLADLIAGLSFHVGEVQRNPYHVFLPAWMMDNVLRGAEWVGGQGGVAPTDMAFGVLYRLRRWHQGRFHPVLAAGKILARNENAGTLFP